jgi:hypothetical protein
MEDQVHAQSIQGGFSPRQSGNETGFYEFFGFSLPISFHRCFIFTHVSSEALGNGPIISHSSIHSYALHSNKSNPMKRRLGGSRSCRDIFMKRKLMLATKSVSNP